GIKLYGVLNGELISINCSYNNGNGITLDSCEFIDIISSNLNNNTLSGILLIDSNYIEILNNIYTINSNEYGTYLLRSHNNTILGNNINFNGVGIYLDESNYNYIDWNNLLGNGKAIVDKGTGNIIGGNNILPEVPEYQFPFDILLIVLIIVVLTIIGVGSALVIRKRKFLYGKKEKEVSEDKKEKLRNYLETRMLKVDNLIEENKYSNAIKNLNKIKATADKYEFLGMFNKASEKIKQCEELEWETFKKEQEAAAAVAPIVVKEGEIRYDVFISYSTLDSDYFQIKKVVKSLKKYPQINKVSFWERDSGESIVEFMEETFKVSNVFILFCSENAMKSQAVKDEWQAAFQMRKRGLLKIIPVYEEEEHIPRVLWHLLNVKYTKDNFDGFIEHLYGELIR
ncbi:MAG: TIR domain-containing protein, partial [Promethearchaeota archaeon]